MRLVYTIPVKSQIKVMTDTQLFKISETIDTCGTRCPIPLLRAKQALKSLATGDYLKVLASDPSAKPDFDAMLAHLPHELVSYIAQEGSKRVDTFIIRKGE